MAIVIAVANQKGGVGKTTTCVNLAASLAATHRRILLVDLDPQSNATMGAGVDKRTLERSVVDVLLDDLPVRDALAATPESGFTLLPSNQELTAAEVELVQRPDREFRLGTALASVLDDYDYVLIDCPPALNMLTVNALTAADYVLVPMQCEYFALEGLSALVETIDRIKASANPRLEIHGILRTMFDPRNNLANEVSSQLTEHFGERVYRTVIPRNVRLAEAPSFGRPVLLHDKYSRGALAYLALAGEINRRAGAPLRAPIELERSEPAAQFEVEPGDEVEAERAEAESLEPPPVVALAVRQETQPVERRELESVEPSVARPQTT